MTAESISEPARPKKLNKREREILRLMADARSPNEIAVELVIAVETVDWYRRQILKKLEARDALQAMSIAQEMGLVEAAIRIEDETLPARPDETSATQVNEFFEKLPETLPEIPVLEDAPASATFDDAETLPERPANWPPVAEWAATEFDPQPFEYENMPNPLLVLKGEEVVTDPLPFDVVLDDLTPPIADDAPLEVAPASTIALEVETAPDESQLVSLEQPTTAPEFLLGFEEIVSATLTIPEPEFALELPAVSPDSQLVSLEQPARAYESLLGFEDLEPAVEQPPVEANTSPDDTTEMPHTLLAHFDPTPPVVEVKLETLGADRPSRKRSRKRKQKSKPKTQPPVVDQAPHDVEQVVTGESQSSSETVAPLPEQPPSVVESVTTIFEIEPVYGFVESIGEDDLSSIPEFTLYTSDQVVETTEPETPPALDTASQSGSEWTAFDDQIAVSTVEQPAGVEAVQGVAAKPPEIVPEPEYVPLNSLPTTTGFLVGRRREITEIKHLTGSLRWLTLTGPGGVGKTRLALEVARQLQGEFPDGVGFVSLATISNPALVQDVILRTLGLTHLKGQTANGSLRQFLGQRSPLLILDHLDSTRHDARQIMNLLVGTRVTIIATARQKLAFSEEMEFSISPLEVPELKPRKRYKLVDLEKADSVAFLIQQIQNFVAGYRPNDEEATLLAQICARLRGIPLALEWVAARFNHYPPQMILMQLDNRLRALGSDLKTPATPQQALHSVLGWSHNLLNRDEQVLFAGLGLFGRSWTLESAEAVFRDLMTMPVPQAIDSLVEKHLIRQQVLDGQKPAFTMDQVVREYALERLKNHDRMTRIREAFAAHYVDLAEYATTELDGAERTLWLKRLEAEHDNFRSVLNWSLEYRHYETLARLTNSLWSFWETTGRFAESLHWLEHSLAQQAGTNAQAQTKLRQSAGLLAYRTGNYAQARGLLEECLVLQRFSGDRQAEAQTLALLSNVAVAEGDETRAADLLGSSLSLGRRLNNTGMIFEALESLTSLATRHKDFNLLRPPLAETLEHFYQNEDLPNLTRSLLFPASLAASLWQCDRAVRLYAVCSALMDTTSLMLPVGESTRYDAALSEMRRFMGPEAFESAWESGFAFTVEQAVAFALEHSQVA